MNNYFFVPKGAVATFLSSGARTVRVTHQELTIEEQNGMAQITITETYDFSNKEMSYYFTLPKGAVITNFQQSNKHANYNASVVPRGAAQKAYLVRRTSNTQQSLLEEVGPSQYRMRIMNNEYEQSTVSFSYITFPVNGKWVFPVLTERRNVYWDLETVRLVNSTLENPLWRLDSDWMTESLPLSPSARLFVENKGENLTYAAQFSNSTGSECYLMSASKGNDTNTNNTNNTGVSMNVAVLIDTSLRMKEKKEALKKELESLLSAAKADNTNITIDAYVIGSEFFFGEIKHQDLAAANLDNLLSVNIGAVDMRQMVRQFQKQRKEILYNSVVIFTNQGNEYSQKENQLFNWNNNETLSVVYLGDTDVTLYSDDVADIIESSGGSIVTSALQAIKFRHSTVYSHDFSFAWAVQNTTCENPPLVHSFFNVLAAHQLIQYLARDNSTLSLRHSLATSLHVVSLYSSFIITDKEGEKIYKEAKEQFNRRLENDNAELKLHRMEAPIGYISSASSRQILNDNDYGGCEVAVPESLSFAPTEKIAPVENMENQFFEHKSTGSYLRPYWFTFLLYFYVLMVL